MQTAIQLAYRMRRWLLARLRLRTRGVKVMLFNPAGELMLVRNGYGATDLWVLPGGGIGRRESPEAAAIREVREELSLDIRGVALLATYQSGAEGKRDTIHLFKAVADGEPKADDFEVIEAAFFPLDALPARASPATLRRIAELKEKQPVYGRW